MQHDSNKRAATPMSHPLAVDDDGSGLALGDLKISGRNEHKRRSVSASSSGSESSTSSGWRTNNPYRLGPRGCPAESSSAEQVGSSARNEGGAPQNAVENDESMSSTSSTSSSTFDKASGHVIEVVTPEVRPAVSVWGTSGQSAPVDNAAPYERQSATQRPLPVGVSTPATVPSPDRLLFTISEYLTTRPPVLGSGEEAAATLLPTGFLFAVWDADTNVQHLVDSATIRVTVGAARYLESFLRHGHPPVAQHCRHFLSGTAEVGRGCASGTACEYLHCVALPLPRSSTASDGERTTTGGSGVVARGDSYRPSAPAPAAPQSASAPLVTTSPGGSEPLPAGVVISVWPPNNANAQPQRIPSEYILRTLGGFNIYQVMLKLTQDREAKLQELQLSGGRGQPPLPVKQPHGLKPRHCAHFQYKKMCNLGSECNFIHSLVPMSSTQPHQHDRGVHFPPPPPPPPPPLPAPVIPQMRPAAVQFASSAVPMNASPIPLQHSQPTYVTVTSAAAAHHHQQQGATYTAHVPLAQPGTQYHPTTFALPQQVHNPTIYSHGGAPNGAYLHHAHVAASVQGTGPPGSFAAGYPVAAVDTMPQGVVRGDASSEHLRLLLLQHGFSPVSPDALFQAGPR